MCGNAGGCDGGEKDASRKSPVEESGSISITRKRLIAHWDFGSLDIAKRSALIHSHTKLALGNLAIHAQGTRNTSDHVYSGIHTKRLVESYDTDGKLDPWPQGRSPLRLVRWYWVLFPCHLAHWPSFHRSPFPCRPWCRHLACDLPCPACRARTEEGHLAILEVSTQQRSEERTVADDSDALLRLLVEPAQEGAHAPCGPVRVGCLCGPSSAVLSACMHTRVGVMGRRDEHLPVWATRAQAAPGTCGEMQAGSG